MIRSVSQMPLQKPILHTHTHPHPHTNTFFEFFFAPTATTCKVLNASTTSFETVTDVQCKLQSPPRCSVTMEAWIVARQTQSCFDSLHSTFPHTKWLVTKAQPSHDTSEHQRCFNEHQRFTLDNDNQPCGASHSTFASNLEQ